MKIKIDEDKVTYEVRAQMPFKVFVGDSEFDYGTWTGKIQKYSERLMKDKSLVRERKPEPKQEIDYKKFDRSVYWWAISYFFIGVIHVSILSIDRWFSWFFAIIVSVIFLVILRFFQPKAEELKWKKNTKMKM